ncbi:MAG: hypothetical protein E5V75_04865 [Mesorhizobium sp.]|nr:MAG: hypothetical protein E5V75_04865 [Mesorhizobium sp.]
MALGQGMSIFSKDGNAGFSGGPKPGRQAADGHRYELTMLGLQKPLFPSGLYEASRHRPVKRIIVVGHGAEGQGMRAQVTAFAMDRVDGPFFCC